MIAIGAYTNAQFSQHKSVLLKLKRYYIEVKTRFDTLKHKKRFECKCLEEMTHAVERLDLSDEDRADLMDR